MHRSLRIAEIVELIFRHLIVGGWGGYRTYSKALAALARTCKTFQNPALDLLWEQQTTLHNYLNCFPRGLIKILKGADIRLLQPITDKDWERPLFYSARVKRLSLGRGDLFASGRELRTLSFGDHIFPNLEAFVVIVCYPASLQPSLDYLPLLLSPRIKGINVQFQSHPALLPQILPALTLLCPSLTHVKLSAECCSYGELEHKALSKFYQNLVRVESLVVEDLDQPTFEHLGRLLSLEALRLENPNAPRMSHLPPSMLPHPPATCWGDESPENVPDKCRIDGATLRTMFCFVNVESVSLRQIFNLDDGDILTMARAWPRLQLLSLGDWSDVVKSRVTLQACPRSLRTPAAATGGVSQASLKKLDVSYSPIVAPRAVAVFLSFMFPEVGVSFDRNEESELESEEAKYGDRWTEVNRILEDLRAPKENVAEGTRRN
ncbi:hypothetical protein B0H17DRAFT_1191269 [Mycena rosella]|uniref:F-box domain-containing protein n=1 Tax=Mycena rosella TaxID=1033263 RepID=A0AAD7H052_MYCRO|nr:hypothetical protein B0H17DRAFT_1191269 [Mycena rosella]